MLRSESAGRRRVWLLLPTAMLIGALFAVPAHAETITLTGGQVILNRTPDLGTVSVNLIGPNFRVSTGGDFAFTQTLGGFRICSVGGCGGIDTVGFITFNGITTSSFRGAGTFDESTIIGSVNLHGNPLTDLDQPPFPLTVDFFGTGRLEITPTGQIFTVSSPVPEPGTMLLLGSGLTAVVAAVRRRRGKRSVAN